MKPAERQTRDRHQAGILTKVKGTIGTLWNSIFQGTEKPESPRLNDFYSRSENSGDEEIDFEPEIFGKIGNLKLKDPIPNMDLSRSRTNRGPEA